MGGKVMQAIIMAAGKGSRLGSRAEGIPKSFVQIHNRKLIEYNLCLLHKYGIHDIVIVTGYRSENFEEFTKNMQGVHLVYNPFYEMVNVLGSFYMGMRELQEDFIYLHADTICEPCIFEEMMHADGDIILPVEFGQCDEEAMKIRRENGRLVQITKQMRPDAAEGEFIGVALFRKKTLPELAEKTTQLLKEGQFKAYFESAIQRLIDENRFEVATIPTKGAFWAEIDYEEDYEKALQNMPQSLIEIVA